jgi:hypothetical protein
MIKLEWERGFTTGGIGYTPTYYLAEQFTKRSSTTKSDIRAAIWLLAARVEKALGAKEFYYMWSVTPDFDNLCVRLRCTFPTESLKEDVLENAMNLLKTIESE